LRVVSSPRISPDGELIAFVCRDIDERNQYVRNIWMVDVDGRHEPRQFTSSGKDACPLWSPDGSRLAFISGRDEQSGQIWTIPSAGGEATALTRFPEGHVAGPQWSPDGRWIAVGFREQDPEWTAKAIKEREESGASAPPRVIEDLWYRLDGDGLFNRQRFALYLVDTATGTHHKLFDRDTLGHFCFAFSPDSRRLAVGANTDSQAAVRPWKRSIYLVDVATRKAAKIPNLPEGPKQRFSWSPDGKHLAYAGREGRDRAYSTENLEVFVCDTRRGGARSLTASTDYCLLTITLTDSMDTDFSPVLLWHPDGSRVLARVGWHGESHVVSIDAKGAAAKGGTAKMLTKGRLEHELGNLSDNGKRVALAISSPVEPAEIHVGEVHATKITTRKLTDINRELVDELELSRPKSHWVSTTNGARVQVWSIAPPSKQASKRMSKKVTKGARKKRPALLCIHGGPHAQYGMPFFHELQFLAASGYTVFYSNPRGSKGYGRDHCAAIRGCWGTVDWEDIQAVTTFMREHPDVDENRIGIAGGSYGGFMTNWAISHSDAYAAAVTDRCVSNLISMFGTTDFPEIPGQYWAGNSWDRAEERWEHSPLKHFGNVKTPTLIIHSEGDLRCSIEQSEQVFSALKLQRVPARFVRYPASTSHGMSRDGPPDLRLHRLAEIVAWLRQYLGR
jgi:acylaminoacyl-peptidase